MISSHPTQIDTGSFEMPVCPQYSHGLTSRAHSLHTTSPESKINASLTSVLAHPSHGPHTVAIPGSLAPMVSTADVLHFPGAQRKQGGTYLLGFIFSLCFVGGIIKNGRRRTDRGKRLASAHPNTDAPKLLLRRET